MGNRIVMREVCCAEELQALNGCTITSVYGHGPDGDEGLCLDCQDEGGNLVSFLITEEGSWHIYDSKEHAKKNLTFEQYGRIAYLFADAMVDSMYIRHLGPVADIVVKVVGQEAAARVLEDIKIMFPQLEVSESERTFEGENYPSYRCDIPNINLELALVIIPSVEGGE